jgi:hypothetical protein
VKRKEKTEKGDGRRGVVRGYGEGRMIGRGEHFFKTLSCVSFPLIKTTVPKMVKPTVNKGNFVSPSTELCLLHNPPYQKSLPVPGLRSFTFHDAIKLFPSL